MWEIRTFVPMEILGFLMVLFAVIGFISMGNRGPSPYRPTEKELQAYKERILNPVPRKDISKAKVIETCDTSSKGVWKCDTLSAKVPNVVYKDSTYDPGIPTIKLLWFCEPWAQQLEMSPAEVLLYNELCKYPVEIYREVSFDLLRSGNGNCLRYDFFIPSLKLCIEYDGKEWHKNEEHIAKDQLKTAFCANYDLDLWRFHSKHYYIMGESVAKMMTRYRVNAR